MTKHYLNTLFPASVGFDHFIHAAEQMLSQAEAATSFPPHNIIKIEDNKYVVELAVAGFSKDDITIKTIDGALEIRGQKASEDKDTQYLYKGIGTRSFVKSLRLAEHTKVRGAKFQDGILSIALENVVPEEKKPNVVEIKDDFGDFYGKSQFLAEDN